MNTSNGQRTSHQESDRILENWYEQARREPINLSKLQTRLVGTQRELFLDLLQSVDVRAHLESQPQEVPEIARKLGETAESLACLLEQREPNLHQKKGWQERGMKAIRASDLVAPASEEAESYLDPLLEDLMDNLDEGDVQHGVPELLAMGIGDELSELVFPVSPKGDDASAMRSRALLGGLIRKNVVRKLTGRCTTPSSASSPPQS